MIFGGVPITVFMPPKILAKANGIKNFDGFHSIFWQMDKVIGSNKAMAPILFMNEDSRAAMTMIMMRN